MMTYKGYIAKVEFDDEAKLLHGEVIGIGDVITFQADSVNEVESAFHDSVDDYLAFCAERGENPDKPLSGKFVARIGIPLHQKLAMLAQFHGKSINSLVEEFLEKEVLGELQVMGQTPSGPSPSSGGRAVKKASKPRRHRQRIKSSEVA